MEDKLKVCLLNDSFPPVVDGVANAVINYAEIIQEKYGTATVATPKYPHVRDSYPFDVVRYPSINVQKIVGYRAGYPFQGKALHDLIDREFDILHCHCPFASAYVARAVREATGKPMIFTYHTKFSYDIKRSLKTKGLQNTAIKFLINNIQACDDVWVVSEGAGQDLHSLGYDGPYTVMENGVDFPCGRVSDERIEKITDLHNLPQGVPVYLFVGRMRWYKGIKIILNGLNQARHRGADFRMIFIGDGIEFKEIVNYTKEIGMDDRCIFTGVIHDRELLRDYFCRANLFLFPSVFDTNGIVVREAAACGLPSVLIGGSCAAEDITDGRNGVIIEETPFSMAEAIVNIGSDFEKMREIGEHAMNDLYMSWDESVAKAVERYKVVIDKCAAGQGSRMDLKMDKLFEMVIDFMKQVDRVQGLPKRIGGNSVRMNRKTFRKK